jgi:hypothetical protein
MEEKLDQVLATSKRTFLELYPHLTAGVREVDEEIENGTWKFTRAQFENYLTVIGCINKMPGGSHEKGALPKGALVTLNGELITIMNDFGGALTLPEWDQDFVPYYLRKQILIARKKLMALAIKVLMAKETAE